MGIKNLLFVIGGILCTNTIVNAQEKTFFEVAYNDCGDNKKQPNLILGENYIMPESFGGDMVMRSCNFGGKVIYAFDKMDIHADYRMEISFFADDDRELELIADGNPICENIHVPGGKVVKKIIDLPRHSFAYGQFVLVVGVAKGANAVVSEIKILSSNKKMLSPVSEEAKNSLKAVQTYTVNTNVNVEEVLPQYIPVPTSVKDVYRNVVSLNGTWDFSESENGNEWHSIQVPGQWSMQGFKVDSASFARYKKDFDIPADWKNKQVYVRFDGVHSEYKVFVNGKQAGYHLGGMTPYDLNITEFLREDNNELSLSVRSESLADMLGSLTQYAAHQLGGITRKVTLFAVPDVHISDLRIITDLDENYKDARLKLYVSVTNSSSNKTENMNVRAMLDNHTAAGTLNLPSIQPGETWSGWLEFDVEAPELWDNEHPNLYNLHLDLYQGTNSIAQIEKKFGFREIEVRGNRMLVNGKPVKLRGVCRHEAHPLYGRSLTDAEWKADAQLYRDANCNFIRTSHYPPAEEFIEYCDELGLFVELEAPVCWIGHHANENWQRLNYKDEKYYEYVLQADMETVHFYRNHPSVVLWSMANESYWNKGFAQVAEYMKKADITRPFAFHDQAYGGFNNQGSTAPVANIHYPGPGGYKEAEKSNRPMTYGEYCHLNVYNRSELVTDPGIRSDWALALQPMWENMYKTDGVLGGSIWSGIDDIFQLPDGNAVGYGAWGPIDGWRRPKPEYWDMKKIYSPIKLHTESLEPSSQFVLDIENRYTYTDFNELKVKWSFAGRTGVTPISLSPGKSGKLIINTGIEPKGGQLKLEFIDPRGFIADEYLIPVGEQTENKISVPEKVNTKLKSSKTEYIITGKGYKCVIDRNTGIILSLEKNGKKILSGGPHLMALPLTGGGCYPNHNADTPIFNDMCEGWTVSSISAEKADNDVLVKVSGSYKDFDGEYSIFLNASGEIKVDYSFTSKTNINPRQWGMVFETADGFDKTFWRRKGLWSVYPSDHISRPVGEAKSFYEEVPAEQNPRIEPTWSWSKDHNQLGSNDFRSTRRNIWYAGLENVSDGSKVTVVSDGTQHWRTWKSGNKSQFLVADFVTAGDEMFLSGHYAPYRKPLKAGDVIKGVIILRVE